MSSHFIRFFTGFLIIYSSANYYIAWHFLQAFRGGLEPYTLFYGGLYLLLALTPFISRLGKDYFPGCFNDLLAFLGAYWLSAVYYLVLLWGLFDLVSLLARLVGAFVAVQFATYAGMGFLLLVAGLSLYGTWNARHPRVVHYTVTVDKEVPGMSKLHAVMVSDIHLGVLIGSDRLVPLVNRINRLNPDIIFLAGDTIDEDVRVFVERKMPEVLRKLTPKYGTYAVLGNHEYIGGHSKLAAEYLEQAGIKVLLDESVKVNQLFYVIGRDDRAAAGITGQPRLGLSQVTAGVDRQLPLFLLDHQPYNLEEGQANGIDLQLSGHTHHGQFFPNNLITKKIYEQDWGYIRKGTFQAIISCGFGTWGPPIRIGNTPEIVDIMISFQGN